MNMELIGRIVFVIGVIIALVVGLMPSYAGTWGIAALVILGVIVGLLNVTTKEVGSFLLATVALLLAGNALVAIPSIGSTLTAILSAFVSFVAGAAIVLALREVFVMAKS